MSKKTTDSTIMLTLLALTGYVMYCVIDIVAYPAVIIERRMTTVVDKNDIVKTILPKETSIVEVASTDKIIIDFKVSRTHFAENSVERVFEIVSDSDDTKELVLYHIIRNQTPGTNVVIAEYDLPDNLKPGCNYVIYSRNNIKYRFNILQKLTGITINSPKTVVCITA